MYFDFFIYPQVEDNLAPSSSKYTLLMTLFNLCSTFSIALWFTLLWHHRQTRPSVVYENSGAL